MNISFCTIAYRFEDKTIFSIVDELGDLGYSKVEIWAPQLKNVLISDLDAHLKRRNMSVSMLSPYFNFTGSSNWWKRSLQEGFDIIEKANQLQCKNIRCFTGKLGSDTVNDTHWKDAVMGIQILADLAKSFGISLCIETHAGTLADRCFSTLKLLKQVNRSNVGLVFDAYNLWEVEEAGMYISFKEMLPHILGIHLKNAKTNGGKDSPFPFVHRPNADFSKICFTEAGDIDYGDIFNTLKNTKFSGFYSVEWFGKDVKSSAKHELEYLKKRI